MNIKIQKTNYLTPTGLKTSLGYVVGKKAGKETQIKLFEVEVIKYD